MRRRPGESRTVNTTQVEVADLSGSRQIRPVRPSRTSERETLKMVAHDFVTFAGGFLEAGAVDDGHAPVRVFDEASLLENAGHHGDAWAARAKHHRQKFVAQLKLIAADAVVRHEEPSAAAFLHGVERHARD